MVQQFDSFSLKISELTQPRSIPGMNSQSLVHEQFSSIRSEPIMIPARQSPQMFILCPRVISQNIENSTPPEPFQPTQMLSITPMKQTRHRTFKRLSRGTWGRYGQSSQRRMIPRQLIRKAVRAVTKRYWRMGMAKQQETSGWIIIRMGARMMRDRLLSFTLGSSPSMRQSYSSERLTLFRTGSGISLDLDLQRSSSRSLPYNYCLLINYKTGYQLCELQGHSSSSSRCRLVFVWV